MNARDNEPLHEPINAKLAEVVARLSTNPAWFDAMTSLDAETSLRHLDGQMKAIEEAHGLEEGELWPLGKAPQEYEKIRQQYEAAWEQMYVAKLDELGEHEMARQYGSDPDGFRRRSEAGRAFFHGPAEAADSEGPDWVYELAEVVAGNTTSMGGPSLTRLPPAPGSRSAIRTAKAPTYRSRACTRGTRLSYRCWPTRRRTRSRA